MADMNESIPGVQTAEFLIGNLLTRHMSQCFKRTCVTQISRIFLGVLAAPTQPRLRTSATMLEEGLFCVTDSGFSGTLEKATMHIMGHRHGLGNGGARGVRVLRG
jgi:hypothetical protein